ncbi:hypothetical protein BM221_005149 [Beauveria bassiana]|uniref:Uncharacterized protein n=1 Tax=Beauveria bassiana TaxID=176275 RepID=A0A2N6NMS3_BEABA|nr:hypothetical protein BM221_005149 [Beauveria bassiana]
MHHTTCLPHSRILLHVVHHPKGDAEGQRGEGERKGGSDDDNNHGIVGVGVATGSGNIADDGHERRGHLVPPKGVLDATAALVAHARGPARLGLDDGLGGAARVGGEDGHAREHGFEGHDAKVLVGGSVDEEGGGAQQLGLEGGGHGEEEEDGGGCVGGLARGGVVGGVDGVVDEVALIGEGLQFAVVVDIFGDATVVAAGEDESHAAALIGGNGGKGAYGEANVLFALEAVDAEEDAVAGGEQWRAVVVVVVVVVGGELMFLGVGVDAGVDDAGGRVFEQLGPGQLDDALGKVGVEGDGVGKAHGPLLEAVKGDAVEPFEERGVAALDEEQVGKVAVKDDARLGGDEQAQPGQAGGELVDDEDGGLEVLELAGEPNVQQEVDVAQDGAENGKPAKEGARDEPRALDADIERGGREGGGRGGSKLTIATFVKAVVRVAVVRVDDYLGALVLQAGGGVDDEALGAADAQVRVEEDVAAADGLGHILGQGFADETLGGLGLATGVLFAERLARRPFHRAHLALGLRKGVAAAAAAAAVAAGLSLLRRRRRLLLHGLFFFSAVDYCVSISQIGGAGGCQRL